MMNVIFHYSNFLAPKPSHATVKDRGVLCLMTGGFSSRILLDNASLVKTRASTVNPNHPISRDFG